MQRIFVSELNNQIGLEVSLAGWVQTRRDHGQIIFIDLRDKTGVVQLVFVPEDKEVYEMANSLRSEWVIQIEGKVKERPDGMKNDKIPTGNIEVEVKKFTVFNESKTPPFEIPGFSEKEKEVSEEVRMQYRYIDLRKPRMKRNLELRHKVAKNLRDFFDGEGFYEVETPDLTKGTPEGAREFIVPSRQQPGKFYVLPQSPQQFKQLLMVAGIERYFQIVRCFRDEDPRGDRQPEFTQLDIEASFIDEEYVYDLLEKAMKDLVEKVFPEKKIKEFPFPRLSYEEAMGKYQNDKPDLRKDKTDNNELAFCWVVDMPLFEYSETEKKLVSTHHPFTHPAADDLDKLEKESKKVKARAYDLVLNGWEVAGGSIRIHERDLQNRVFKILGLSDEEVEARFGHMLSAFEYGAPPHGGIAVGFDRLVMVLVGEPNIREVIAFPKTGDGRDLMMEAPADINPEQLKELKIKVEKEEEK
jgi:aspartyl-tRNA synthetase